MITKPNSFMLPVVMHIILPFTLGKLDAKEKIIRPAPY